MSELRPLRTALCEIAEVLDRGREKHPRDEGFLPSTAFIRARNRADGAFQAAAGFHIERARTHLEALARGDTDEAHLSHAAARLLMALQVGNHVKE